MRTFGKIEHKNGKWVLYDIEPHVVIKLKNIFKGVSLHKEQPFIFDDREETALDLEWFMNRYPLLISDSDKLHLIRQKTKHLSDLSEAERIFLPSYTPRKMFLKIDLRKYQIQAVDLFMKMKYFLLGDGVGIGKSATAIGILTDPSCLPALVVVQTHLPKQWKDEIAKFTDLSVHIIDKSTPYSLPPADVYIVKYSNIAKWADILGRGFIKTVVLDEAQELRRQESLKYSAVKMVTKKASGVIGLSATPVYNRGSEIFNILDIIKEGCLGDYESFHREWCYGEEVRNPKALGTYLRENHLFLRRTKEEVSLELPPINKIVHTVDYDKEAVASVESLARTLAIKSTTASFVERGQAARELDILIRKVTGVSKAKYVAQYVSILLENKVPVLLAGWHRDCYDIWLEELKQYNPVMYTGSESPTQKEASKQAFINGDSNLMIISLRSGVGLDGLQKRCNTVVFGELDWTNAIHEQVIGRLNRYGQENQVTAIYLVSQDGSDPLMVNLLGLKASLARDIVDPTLPIGVQFSDESRLKLLAEQYLKGKTQCVLSNT